jgi:hypothetical protein
MSFMSPGKAQAQDLSFGGTFIMGMSSLYSNDPCPPDRRQQLESRIESAVSKYIEMIPLSFIEPKHVKQIVNCLTDLLNVGLTISGFFSLNWSALLSNILSDLINRACQAATRAVDKVISEIQANIQLPNIAVDILGQNVQLFGGSIGGGLTRGGSGLGSIDIQLNTPVGQSRITSPGFAVPR